MPVSSLSYSIRQVVESNEICLTSRELQCLDLLSAGMSAKEIARKMLISPRTAESYIDKLKQKMNCRSTLHLMSKLLVYFSDMNVACQ